MSEIIDINNTKLSKDELNNLLIKNGFKLTKIKNKPNIIKNVTDFHITSYDNTNNSIITFKNKDDDIIFTINFKNKKLLTYKNSNANTKYIKLLSNFEIIEESWLIKFVDVLDRLCSKSYGISLLTNNENYFRLIEFLCKKDFKFSFRYNSYSYGVCEDRVNEMITYLQQFKMYNVLNLSYGRNGISLNDFAYLKYDSELEILFHKKLEQFVDFNSELDTKVFFAFCDRFDTHFLRHKNHKLLFDYVKYSFINQGLPINHLTLGLYRDYLSMSKRLYGNDFDWYPKYLKTQHDIVQQNLKVQSSEDKNTKYLSIKEKNANLIFSNEQYSILLPQDIDDIIKEGKDLNHCIASYIDEYILYEDSFVVFMRSTHDIDRRLITLQIRDNKIIQQKGFSNRDPYENELVFIEKYQAYLDKLTKEALLIK